jgi:ankyrin repeat protein
MTGNTALMLAIAKRQFDVARELIEANDVDLNVVNLKGETVLHLLARSGDPSLVSLALERGANVFTPNHLGTPSIPMSTWCRQLT